MDREQWLTTAEAIAGGSTVDWGAKTRAGAPRREAVEGRALPFTRWGPFTLLEQVGDGTFGEVYRARDPHLDRPIALKLLKRPEPGQASDSSVIDEARLMARVRHPNVVTILGADRIDGRVGVWMEFIDGQSLEEELRANGPLAPDDVAAIGRDLCNALIAIHDAGLLPRDLRTQNVMRDANRRVVLTDFGLGRDVSLASDALIDSADTAMYMAPERLTADSASPQSEVYGLGVLLFHLATGSFPVDRQPLHELREAHAAGGSRVQLPDSFPSALAVVIQTAIAPDPSARFQSPAEMASAIAAAKGGPPPFRMWFWSAVWFVIVPMLIGALMGVIMHRRIRAQYQSQAVIQVVPPKVVSEFSAAPRERPLEERLESLKQHVLDRSHLEQVIIESGLYSQELARNGLTYYQTIGDVVETFRKNIAIDVVDKVEGRNTIAVVVTGTHPSSVQTAAAKLAAMLINEHSRQSSQNIAAALANLESKVGDIERQLAEYGRRDVGTSDQAAKRQAQLQVDGLESSYRALLADRERARAQVNIESRQLGEQFNLIDPARLPQRPIGWSRAQKVVAGAVVGLVLGVAAAMMGGLREVGTRRTKIA